MQRTLRCSLTLILVGAALTACGGEQGKPATPAPGSDEALMATGLSQLQNDPIAAEGTFRELLRKTPTHYGAHYQLAVALDRGGKPVQARSEWEQVRGLAEASNDSSTLATARKRLASPDTASQEAMMALGLDLLYKQGNAPGAVAQFRAVLRKNPTHYGATYQLATALDRSGQLAQAQPVWQRMLGMATQNKDSAVIKTARERLK